MFWLFWHCLTTTRTLASADDVVDELRSALTEAEKWSLLSGVEGPFVGQLPGVPRLGIPSLKLMDNGQGVRTMDPRMVGTVTAWSCALGLASAWDEGLVRKFAEAAAEEFKTKGANVVLGPAVNVHRVARGGRNAEYLSGEDPYLGSRLGKPWVDAFHKKRVLTTAKHFILNNQETNRMAYNANCSERAFQELYGPPFFAVNSSALMCSYNRVFDGTYACSNERVLFSSAESGVLGGGGEKKLVMSDWGATHGTTLEEGLDVDMPGSDGWFSPANLSQVDPSFVDRAVGDVLRPIVDWGLLNSTTCDDDCEKVLYETDATSEEHSKLAEKIATESVLLLKNDGGLLPFDDDDTLKIGVVGSACDAANDVAALLGQWDLGNYYVIGGSGRVVPKTVVTVYEGLGRPEASVLTDDDVDAALALDVDLYVTCGGAVATEGSDRDSLRLDQEDFLVDFAKRKTKPAVVVLLAPGAVVLPFLEDVEAVVAIFLGGAATGTAVANVLRGFHSPAAKSPISWPKTEDDAIPPCLDRDCPYSEDLEGGYRGQKDVAFEFGRGLSYASFHYEWLRLPVVKDNVVEATISVENNGTSRSGAEVPQLYVRFPAEAREPRGGILRGFQKTPVLAPGDKTNVTFTLDAPALRVFLHGRFTAVPGDYVLLVGSSSRDLRLNATVQLFQQQTGVHSTSTTGSAVA